MPSTLETWSVFSIQKHVWMCALHPKNICLHFFFSILGTRCGSFIIYFFFLIQQIFTIFFLHHPKDIYYNEPSTMLPSLWPTLKPKKMKKKKERTSVSLLHSSKLTRPVACANRAGQGMKIHSILMLKSTWISAALHWMLLDVMSHAGSWKAVQKQDLLPREL